MLRRWVTRLALTLLVGTGAAAWGTLSMRGMNAWVFHITKGSWFKDLRDVPPRQIAIVPGTGFHRGRPNAPMEERLWLALHLYEAGRVNAILVSGNEAPPGYEVSGMQQWLIRHGVPSTRIIVDPLGVRTLATMTRAVGIFGIRNAIVCTQSWAAPRAVFLARGAGIDAFALVPQAVSARPSTLLGPENLKVTLAFVERYVLGRTRALPAESSTVLAATFSGG